MHIKERFDLFRFLANLIVPLVVICLLTLGSMFLLNKIINPSYVETTSLVKIEEESKTRIIDPSKVIKGNSVSIIMSLIQKNNFEFLIVARDISNSNYVNLLFAKKGDSIINQLTLPLATYNNIETNYLLPQKINFEVANAEFISKNIDVLNGIKEIKKTKTIDWEKELIGSFGIGLCFAICWLVVEPAFRYERRIRKEMDGSANPKYTGKAINPSHIQGDMNELIGLEDIKLEVLQIEDMIKNSAIYKSHGIEKTFNILMSGPAGTGKTKMASYLAKSLNIPMFSQPAGALETGLIGGGSQTLNGIYDEARQHPLSIVFLDEGQVLLSKRGLDSMRKNADDTANTLLAILDGTNTVNQNRVITIVASNFNDNSLEMDEAMLRRFPLKIDFRLPNLEERREILKFYLEKKERGCVDHYDLNLNYIADITSGMSPALLNNVTDKASMISIQEDKAINTEILFRAYERTSIGLTDRAKTAGRDDERRRIARHELGHLFMQIAPFLNQKKSWHEIKEKSRFLKISTEAVAKVNALGYVLSSPGDASLKTLNELEQDVMELYGGVGAEEIFYGANNISVGSSNDVEKVTQILNSMVNKLSMYGKSKLNYSMLKVEKNTGLDKMEEIAERLYDNTLIELTKHKLIIEKLTEVLLKEYVLNKDQVFDWLEQNYQV